MTTNEDPLDEWAIVEMMGHRRVVGRVREVSIAGAGMLRIDEVAVDDQPGRTQYVSPGSVYAMHPVSQDIVEQLARRYRTAPVQRYELEASRATTPSEGDPWNDGAGADPDDEGPF